MGDCGFAACLAPGSDLEKAREKSRPEVAVSMTFDVEQTAACCPLEMAKR